MKTVLLTVITLSAFSILPTCLGHLPYFNSQVAPSRAVAKQNYWSTHGSHSSAKWPQFPSQRASSFSWWSKVSSPQYKAHRPTFSPVTQTAKYPPPMQHSTRKSKVDDSSNLSTLIHQLQQKLYQIEHQLAESGTPKQSEPQKETTEEMGSKSNPKQKEALDNDPFWVQLDVVNKQLDPERLIKTINILLENLKESTAAPAVVSEENVYNLIDIRSNFLSR